jgi:hypothetical protein
MNSFFIMLICVLKQASLLEILRFFIYSYTLLGSQDSIVGKATGYRLEDRGVGVQVLVGSRIFSSLRSPD